MSIDIELLHLGVPFITFFMGVLATLWIKKWEAKRDLAQRAMLETRDLVNDWYSQFHKLSMVDVEQEEGIAEAIFFEYVNNLEILPRIIMNLEVLRRNMMYQKYTEEVENFLEMVTDYRPGMNILNYASYARSLTCKTQAELCKFANRGESVASAETALETAKVTMQAIGPSV